MMIPSRSTILMSRQRGAVLLFSLIILLLLTVIGVTAMQTTTLQERMSGNFRDRQVAFQGAEAGLMGAERFVLENAGSAEFGSGGGLYHWDIGPDAPRSRDFESASTRSYTVNFGDLSDLLFEAPEFFVEELRPMTPPGGGLEADQPLPEAELYRIVVRSTGASGQSDIVLQSYYRR